MRFRLLHLTSLLIALNGAAGQSTEVKLPGLAYVTTIDGTARQQTKQPTQTSIAPGLHDRLFLSQSTLWTGADSLLALALSNGVALGLGPQTTVEIPSFLQAPFRPEKASLSYEPSVSQTVLRLESGMLAISCDHLSPLSELWIHLPKGKIRVHSAVGVVTVDESGSRIAVYEGHLTYYYPDSAGREFISAPQSIRISPSSAAMGSIAEELDARKLPVSWKRLSEATDHAAKRVFFLATEPDASAPAEPVLIVKPDYYELPPSRPYGYTD